MDFEIHTIQKYTLAIAIEILRIKPPDLPIDTFLQEFKAKFDKNNITQDISDSEINDDDFVFNQNDGDATQSDVEFIAVTNDSLKNRLVNHENNPGTSSNNNVVNANEICEVINDNIESTPVIYDPTVNTTINNSSTIENIPVIINTTVNTTINDLANDRVEKESTNVDSHASLHYNYDNGRIHEENDIPNEIVNRINVFFKTKDTIDDENVSKVTRDTDKAIVMEIDNISIGNTPELVDHEEITATAAFINEIVDEEVVNVEPSTLNFKVLVSLDTIKKYLAKNSKSSEDSGFREFSQTSQRCSGSQRETQIEHSVLDESGNTLIAYVEQCDLTSLSSELTREIAFNLATLVDLLHTKGNHMSFFEKLLDVDQELMEMISCQRPASVAMFLKKQEIIMKIMLLSKSSNVTDYTVKILLKKLETFYDDLVGDRENAYDLTGNIEQVETSCYLFDILRSLLESRMKSSGDFSASQISKDFERMDVDTDEEEMIEKANKFVNLWRSKWVAGETVAVVKLPQIMETEDKVDVYTACGDLLTKYIVNCTEMYSLISYSALKCYNLLQNKK